MIFLEKEFINALTKKVKRELNYKITVTKEDGCLIIWDEEGGVIQEINVDFLEYIAQEGNLNKILNLSCSLVEKSINEEIAPPDEELLENIFPVLQTKKEINALIREYKDYGLELIYRESGFANFFVVIEHDAGEKVGILPTAMLEELDMTEDELFNLAIRNLKNKKSFPTHVNEGDVKMTYYNSGSGYEASRILTMPLAEIEKGMKGDLLVVIPYRGFLGIFDSAEAVDMERIYISNLVTFKKFAQAGVTPDIFRFRDGKLIERISGPSDLPFA